MTLLETLQAIDVPGCVAWLSDHEFWEGSWLWNHKQYQYGQPYWRSGVWVRRIELQPTDEEIQACLAGVG